MSSTARAAPGVNLPFEGRGQDRTRSAQARRTRGKQFDPARSFLTKQSVLPVHDALRLYKVPAPFDDSSLQAQLCRSLVLHRCLNRPQHVAFASSCVHAM